MLNVYVSDLIVENSINWIKKSDFNVTEGVDGEEVTGCLGGLCQNLCGAVCQAAGVEGEDAEGVVGCLG